MGAPDSDRDPEIGVASDAACAFKVKVIACPPAANPNGPVKIYINPRLTWQQYQQPAGHDGGNAVVQYAALASVAHYLALRDMQRTDPSLLTAADTRLAEIVELTACKDGEVYGGLHGVMNGELTKMYMTTTSRQGTFNKGTRGEC